MITAFGTLETATKAVAQGVFDYITKPFKKVQLIFTVERAMRWQLMKQDAAKMSALFAIEPYEKAIQSFEEEYIKRLSLRCQGNIVTMSEHAALPPERINTLLQATTKVE